MCCSTRGVTRLLPASLRTLGRIGKVHDACNGTRRQRHQRSEGGRSWSQRYRCCRLLSSPHGSLRLQRVFKKATIIVNSKELAAAKASENTMSGYVAADWENSLVMKTIDGQEDIFGDGRITLVPLPGHTVGTMGALVRLDRSGEFLLASDAVSLRVNLDQNTVPKNTKDAELFLRSFAEIRRFEAKGATIICGHDDAQWQSLRKGADAYD